MRTLRRIWSISFLFSSIALLWSQAIPDGKKISSIEVELNGPQTLGKSFILQNLQVEEGISCDPASIDKSIRNLIATGSVEDVKVFIDPNKTNSSEVALVFRVTGKARIGEIIFEGNDKLSDKKLEKTISLAVGDLLDASKVKADQRLLEDKYLEKGYWNSNVESEIRDQTSNGKTTVIFRIVENEKRQISKITFSGNENLSSSKLLGAMETAPWRFWRFWSKRSRYRPSVLEEDLTMLREVYRSKGFLDVSIEQSGVAIIPRGTGKLDIVIKLSEGIRSYFGKSTMSGNLLFTTSELLGKSEIKQGDPYSPSVLSEERSRLRKIYGEKGYLDARVLSVRTPNLKTQQIDLRFQITENKEFSVNSVLVRGNEKTKTIAIIRELALAPGETFDLLRMETSEARLKNTKFFEKVTLDDEPIASQDPEIKSKRRNLVVDVEEGRSGHVSFGVGFSSLEKAMMFAEFRR